MGILLLFLNACIKQIEGVCIKKYNSKHSAGGFIFTALISFFAMLFFVITNTNGFNAPLIIWIYGTIGGMLYGGASFLTYMALGCGSFALSMLVLSYSLVFTIGYGLFFLKEEADALIYIGLLIMLLSLYFTAGKSQNTKKTVSVKWVICIVLSCVCCGFFSILQRMQQIEFNNQCTNEFMIIALAIATVLLMIAGLVKENKKGIKEILKYGTLYAAGAGLSNGALNMLWFFINTFVPISLSSPIGAGMGNIVSFLISVFIFKERLLKRQIFGVMLGTVALILLNI